MSNLSTEELRKRAKKVMVEIPMTHFQLATALVGLRNLVKLMGIIEHTPKGDEAIADIEDVIMALERVTPGPCA